MFHEGQKTSFFDDLEDRDYQIWRRLPTTSKKFSDVRLFEGLLFKKSSKSGFFKSRYYVLFEDRLAYYKSNKDSKEQSYCILQNMRLEKIPTTVTDKEEKFGFRLTRNCQYTDLYARAKDQQDKWISKLKQFCIMTNYSSLYINIKMIGKGSFAKVYLVKRKSDNADLAVKTFDKNALENVEKAKASLINEINIMRKLDQENIIKLYEVHENDSYIFLVLELLGGGELFDRIIKKGAYSEKDACILMTKLMTALEYMHSKGIMHRDLKLENLVLKDADNDYDIKLADFGLATLVTQGEYLFKRCGTPGYVAPEILNDEKYDQKVDVFSAGVILYILLTGSSPFHGKTYNEILLKNKNCEVKFNFKEAGLRVSEQAVDLMKRMLERDPAVRISSREALDHEWITHGGNYEQTGKSPIYLSSAQDNMKKFQEEHRFNVKNIKPKGLDRSLHCPSPIINGKLTTCVDSRVLQSPDSPYLMKQQLHENGYATSGYAKRIRMGSDKSALTDVPGEEEEDGDIDQISDEQNFVDMHINKYHSPGDSNASSSFMSLGPHHMFNSGANDTKNTQKIQHNLLNFLKENPNDNKNNFNYQDGEADKVRFNLQKITEDRFGSLDYINNSPSNK